MASSKNRQFEGIIPHSGKCTEQEIRSLQKCNMEGSRPFANLIAASYAVIDPNTEDWALTDLGLSKIREWTYMNPTKYIP